MCYPAQNTTDLGAGEQPPESFQTVVSIFLKTAATPSVLETLLYLEKIQLIFLNQDGDLWEFYSWKPTPFLSHCTPPSQAPHPTSSYFFSLPSFQQMLSFQPQAPATTARDLTSCAHVGISGVLCG